MSSVGPSSRCLRLTLFTAVVPFLVYNIEHWAATPEHRTARILRQRSLVQRKGVAAYPMSATIQLSGGLLGVAHLPGEPEPNVEPHGRNDGQKDTCTGRAHLELWGDLIQ